MENIVALVTVPLNILIDAGLRKPRIARVLAIARERIARRCVTALVTIAALSTPDLASATEAEVFVQGEFDGNGNLQFSDDGTPVEELTYDGDGGPVTYVFYDPNDGNSTWPLGLIEAIPGTVADCERTQGAVECTYDGSEEVSLRFEATDPQTGAKKQKPIVLKPPPETQPNQAENSPV